MKLRLERFGFTDRSTLGRIFLDDKMLCFSLEDTDIGLDDSMDVSAILALKIKGITAIPYGEYKVISDFSNRFQREMPHILNVKGFEGIRIHPGNTDKDTDGCILVGKVPGRDFIGQSRECFNELFALIKDKECTIEITRA